MQMQEIAKITTFYIFHREMQLSARAARLLKCSLLTVAILALIGTALLVAGGFVKDNKQFDIVKSTCELGYDFKNQTWLLSIEVHNITYSNPIGNVLVVEEFHNVSYYYKSLTLPGSLKLGSPPSVKWEISLIAVGAALFGLFLVFYFVCSLMIFCVKPVCVDKDGLITWVTPTIC